MRARAVSAAAALALLVGWGAPASADPPNAAPKKSGIDRYCELIALHAEENGLPAPFFARLIWKESRFDPGAVSPVGAEGIAQFMPGTAKEVGLADPFDPEQAIPASARHLRDLKAALGNLGLAAAAYNAGAARVGRWLRSGGFLPLETEDYVLSIMGEPADRFTDIAYAGSVQPLAKNKSFDAACRALPAAAPTTVAMARVRIKPWGIQVAGNFRRAAAVAQYERLKSQVGGVLKGHRPVVSRLRTPIGRRGIYAVRIGADSRADADGLCQKIRGAGGACVVMKNR